MATAPIPSTESREETAARSEAQQIVFHFTVGDDTYHLAPFNVPIREKLIIQGQTGLPWETIIRPFTEDQMSSASLAVLVWAARRASGERGLSWDAFAVEWDDADLGLGSVLVEVTGPDGDDPEASGPA